MDRARIRRHPAVDRLLRAAPPGEAIDFIGRKDPWGIEIAENLRGVRDLSAHAFRLGRWVARHPGRRAGLVVLAPRISPERLAAEWAGIHGVFKKDIAHRIVLIGSHPRLASPHAPKWLSELLDELRESRAASPPQAERAVSAPGPKLFDVVKILLGRWLRRLEPMAVLHLGRQAGCSYPTVSTALERLESYGELSRASDRSVALADFPRRTWNEILALLPVLRETVHFVDESGRPPGSAELLSRLKRQSPGRLAVGGVEAARHWDPHFDLHGTPRLDVTLHAHDREDFDLGFVKRLDPALRRTAAADPRQRHTAVLAVHRLARGTPLFEANPRGPLPWADPVETLLDLHELRLVAQADELIERLRKSSG